MIDSIDGLTEGTPISQEFVGLILLPLISNVSGQRTFTSVLHCTHPFGFTEHVAEAGQKDLTLPLGVALGSSIVRAYILLDDL